MAASPHSRARRSPSRSWCPAGVQGHWVNLSPGKSICICSPPGKGCQNDPMWHARTQSEFNIMFADGCLEENIHPSLLQFLYPHRADIKSQIQSGASKSELVRSQLLQYNCSVKYEAGLQDCRYRYPRDHEAPSFVYVGLSVYGKSQKQLITMLHKNGLCISYYRVLKLSAQLGVAAVAQYVEGGAVCPSVLRWCLLTALAADNIDHNLTVTTATVSFHGTSVLVFQHPSSECHGKEER